MKPRLLLIDNYDSFTYNLVQLIGTLGVESLVRRNDEASIDQLGKLQPTHVLISPGPRAPNQAGISLQAIAHFAPHVPVLGVCLGHQCIAQHFGGRVVQAQSLVHGKSSRITHDGKGLFKGIPNPFFAGRYHSLAVADPPVCLEISARADDGEIMALRHRSLPVQSVQFHPESFLTEHGKTLLHNFLSHPLKAGFA